MAERRHERVAAVEARHWWFATLRERVAREVARRHGPGARVLDAGCGTGGVLRALPAHFERTGVDVDPAAFGGEGEHDGIRFVAGSVLDLPFGDGAFDAVVSLDVLSDEGVADPLAGARELRRVLRPGGTLVLNLPAYEWLRSGHDVAAGTGRRFSRRRAVALLREAGFAPEHVTGRVTALFPLAAAGRLARRGGSSSDVAAVPAALDRALTALVRAEDRLSERVPLPFGLSIFAVAAAGGPARRGLRERALASRRLVHAAQFAVTGERLPRRVPLLAGALRDRPHGFVLDLGCGSAPLLGFVAPERYVGIDGHGPSLDEARRTHAGPGREFVGASLEDLDLSPWRGADAVVLSSVTHHLDDEEVLSLLGRIAEQVEPTTMLVQDAEATGPLKPVVTFLDEGDHLRPRARLEALLAASFETRCLWTYDNPLRSFHQYLLEVRPRVATPARD